MSSDAVLLMAYGSPDRLDQVEDYYTDIEPFAAIALAPQQSSNGAGYRRSSPRRSVSRWGALLTDRGLERGRP